MLIIGLGRKGSKLPPSTASCCRPQDVTSSHQPPGGCSPGPGPRAWSRPLHRGARLKALPARGLPGSEVGGCRFCCADESGTDVLGAVMCGLSRGSWCCPCAACSPRGGRTPLGLCCWGRSQHVGTAEPLAGQGHQAPSQNPTCSLPGACPAPCLYSMALPSRDPRFGFSFIKTASASVCRNHKLRLPPGCSNHRTEAFQESLASALP